MGLPAFDTLKFVEKLEKGGFSKEQAKSMAEAQREVVTEIIEGNLATKTDLFKVESGLKADIASIKSEFRAEMAEMNNKIDTLRAEFSGKYVLQNWMIGFNLVICVGILLKLFH